MPEHIKTLCPYCGVGCGLVADVEASRLLRVRGDADHPANFGKLCPKGATVAQTVNTPTRLRYAMHRDDLYDDLVICPGHTAVRDAARRLDQVIQRHGPQAVAFYLSGQLTTESQYLANKFAKAYLRTNHVDSNSRLCMASAAKGMKLSLGSDGPPTCYADIELADGHLFVGSNAAHCHPVLFDRVAARVKKERARCIVVDPRRTATAEIADVHLAIRPGTDLVLMNGLLRLFRDVGKIDKRFIAEHTEGWPELNALLDECPPDAVARTCGIAYEQLMVASRILIESERLLTYWTMGVNQTLHGTYTSNAIINLHLATGMIGKPGCGPFSLTGQPNAMGGRDVGYMSHSLPGYRSIGEPEHRRQMEQLWGLPAGAIHDQVGYDAVRMFDGLEAGEIRAIWIIGTNPAASMPDLPRVRRALENAELVIVQDAYYPTETTRYAHIVLPAAVNLEQDGTFCNSERRVTLMQKVVDPPGDAMPDWWWVKQVAAAMGFTAGMRHENAAQIFDEFARTTAGRPNDQSALHHELLRAKGPQQWPFPAMGRPHERRYTDGKFPTPSGKARLWARELSEGVEQTCPEFPLRLTTGRVLNQWHTRTKTGNVDQLNKMDPKPFVQMHPDDAARLELAEGNKIDIRSRRGKCIGDVHLDPNASPGTVFVPIHWNELWAKSSSPNEVTSDEADSLSRQPALKCCAVSVTRIDASRTFEQTSSESIDLSPSPSGRGNKIPDLL